MDISLNLLVVCHLNIFIQIDGSFIWEMTCNYINYTIHGFHILFTYFECPMYMEKNSKTFRRKRK